VNTIGGTATHVLIVSDVPATLDSLQNSLSASFYELTITANLSSALQWHTSESSPDVVLVELKGAQAEALQTVPPIRTLYPAAAIIVLSSPDNTREVVEAIRLGAQDYLTTPLQEGDLQAVLKRHLVPRPASGDAMPSTLEVENVGNDQFFVASGPEMRKIRMQAKMLAGIDVPVLILGECGTGKEMIARLIHKFSPRAGRRFLKVDCAAFSADLLESELFGDERGTFTGVQRTKLGKFELCDKGTILLNQIDEMPTTVQVKLLHALQDKQFFRLGGDKAIKADARILAAGNGYTKQVLEEKKLRQDLYYRLSTFTVLVPPLRQRKEEIPFLVGHFMRQMAKQYSLPPRPLSEPMLDVCQSYMWPGNLRQLENFVRAYLVLGDEALALSQLEQNKASDRRNACSRQSDDQMAKGQERIESLKFLTKSVKGEAEQNAIAAALRRTGWNRKAAARLLQVGYRTLLYKIEQYGMTPPSYVAPYVVNREQKADRNEG